MMPTKNKDLIAFLQGFDPESNVVLREWKRLPTGDCGYEYSFIWPRALHVDMSGEITKMLEQQNTYTTKEME